RRSGARGAGARADGDDSLPQVPEPVDRRQQRADGGRHAPRGPHPHRRRRKPGGSARLAGRTLRRLRQLRTARHRGDMAVVRDSRAAAGGGAAGRAPPAGEAPMSWVLAIGLAAAAFAAMAFALRLPRAAWTSALAALALGLAGYALQGEPELAGAPRDAAVASAGVGEPM